MVHLTFGGLISEGEEGVGAGEWERGVGEKAGGAEVGRAVVAVLDSRGGAGTESRGEGEERGEGESLGEVGEERGGGEGEGGRGKSGLANRAVGGRSVRGRRRMTRRGKGGRK